MCIKISIVSAFYNVGENVVNVIESVLSQSYDNFEYCIVDGESCDDTVKYIDPYLQDKKIKFISEKDNSIGEAWNKGVKLCSGDLVIFLGAGDLLTRECLIDVANAYKKEDYKKRVIMVGACQRKYNCDDYRRVFRRYIRALRPISLRFWFPACVIPLDLFDVVGEFDEHKKVAVDTDWLIRAIKHNVNFSYHDKDFVEMEAGGMSDKLWSCGYHEYLKSLRDNGLNNIYDEVVSYLYRGYKKYIYK